MLKEVKKHNFSDDFNLGKKVDEKLCSGKEHSIVDLIDFDDKHLNAYIVKLIEQKKISEFITNNRVDKNNEIDFLLKLMSSDNLELLKRRERNFYRISVGCKNIFPENFICDVAIIASLCRLRMITETIDECCPQPDTEEFTTNREVWETLGELRKLLKCYMQENYAFDRVVMAIIMYCGVDGTEYDLETREIPQECDYYILEQVVNFAKKNFDISKIPVSEDALMEANIVWMNTHGLEDWSHNYEVAKPEIECLTEWFYENCDVQGEEIEDGECEVQQWEKYIVHIARQRYLEKLKAKAKSVYKDKKLVTGEESIRPFTADNFLGAIETLNCAEYFFDEERIICDGIGALKPLLFKDEFDSVIANDKFRHLPVAFIQVKFYDKNIENPIYLKIMPNFLRDNNKREKPEAILFLTEAGKDEQIDSIFTEEYMEELEETQILYKEFMEDCLWGEDALPQEVLLRETYFNVLSTDFVKNVFELYEQTSYETEEEMWWAPFESNAFLGIEKTISRV